LRQFVTDTISAPLARVRRLDCTNAYGNAEIDRRGDKVYNFLEFDERESKVVKTSIYFVKSDLLQIT